MQTFNDPELNDIKDKYSDQWKERLKEMDKKNEDLKKMISIMKHLGVMPYTYRIGTKSEPLCLVWDGDEIVYYDLDPYHPKKLIECTLDIRGRVYRHLKDFFHSCMSRKKEDENGSDPT